MTVYDLIDTVRRDILDDVTEPYLWEDAFLLSSVDRAQRQACNRRDLIYDATTSLLTEIPLIATVQAYQLSSEWTAIERLLVDGRPLTKRTIEELDAQCYPTWRVTQGIPEEYAQRLYTVYLVPIPASNGTLKVEGYRMPIVPITEMTSVLEIPPEFHDDLKWWVAYDAYNKRDAETYQPQRALECLANFERVFGPNVPAGVRINQLNNPRIATVRQVDYLNHRRQRRREDF